MDESPEKWEVISSREIADCRVFTVRGDLSRNGDLTAEFYVIENPDWVNVIPVTPDGDIVLIEQFRHGVGAPVLEIPGGMIDAGEEPEAAARRELLEETGYESADWRYLGWSHPNPAIQCNRIHHFAAFGAVRTGESSFDEHESIAVRTARPEAVRESIRSGVITHSLVTAAFYYFDLETRR